jgi:hypothetical protein
MHKVLEHARNARLLFVGHERGLHVSIDGGAAWSSLALNMPGVPVDDLLVHPRDNDLVVGTHGRSIWILDDIAWLEALTPEVVRSDAFLVPPGRARLLSIYSPQAWYGAGQFFAPNPEFGAGIRYYLREASRDDVEILVSDATGQTVRTLRGSGRAGLNQVSWDLRMEPPIADGARDNAAPAAGPGAPPQGPLVVPGTYTVTVRAGGRALNGVIRVDGDPRVTFPDADRKARQAALLNLYDLQKTLAASRTASRFAMTRLDALKRADNSEKSLQTRVSQLQAEITAELNTASALSRAIEGYSGLPTADQRRQIDWVFQDVSTTVEMLNTLLRNDPIRTAQPPIAMPPQRR